MTTTGSVFRRWWCLAGCWSLLALNARAHYCGPPVYRCRPGDIITYYIVSDRAEQGVSLFSVFSQSNPSVAPVAFYTPVGAAYGLYVIKAQQVGTNQIAAFWSFPPNSASGFCVFEVRVTTNAPPPSAGNFPFGAFYGDPVNMYTGELVFEVPPDFDLGGPNPLQFRRYYASRLQGNGLVNSRLGNNWSHNFDWRSLPGLTNEALIVSPKGLRVAFNKSGTNWVLQSPTWAPFQLVNSGNNVIFGDPRDNHLYTFNTNGLLTAFSDGKGNVHSLSYSNAVYTNNEVLVQVSDGLGRTLNFDYIGAHQLQRVSDGTRTAGFAQVEIGTEFNLIRATNTLGRVTTYTYDNSKSVGSLLTSTVYPAGNAGYTQVYDNDARVTQQTRLGTNVTRFIYDTNNFITYVTNALGGLHVYSHSADGHLLGVGDPAGQSLTLATNALGLRARVTDRDSGSYGIAYDAPGAPSAVTNADGSVTSFTYTNRNVNGIVFREIASVTLPDGAIQQFTYDAVGNLISHRDAAGKLTRASYNARGQVTGVTNAVGGVATLAYNADGTLASQADAETGTVTYQHDSLRRPTNAIASDARSIKVTFDAGDRIVSITDERTNTTSFAYDFSDRLTAVTNALGQVTQFTFDTADRLTRVTDRAGFALRRAYDKMDRVIAQTNRNGNAVQFGWDTRARLVSQTDPAGKSWAFGYNNEGLANKITTPHGHVTGFARNVAGFLTAITNALGQTTLFGRDAVQRLKSAVDPLGRLDQFTYEPRGLLTNTAFSAIGIAVADYNDLGFLSRIIDQRGGQWRFNYTALGRLTNSVDALNRTNSITHDLRGRPQRFVYADGATQTNSYDPSGNLAQLDFSGGSSLTFGYDKLHRLTNAPNLALAYDPEDRVTNTVSAGVNFAAMYDAGGRLTNASYNNGAFSVSYTYDSRDRLTQVRDSLTSAQVNFFYNDDGQLTNVTRANGVSGIYDHDAAGRVTRIREGAFLDLQYGFDAAGNTFGLTQTAPLVAMSPPQTNNFAYDAAQQISTGGYSYDARGRLTASPGHTYIWNAASQLVRVDSVTNTFNGAGNLLTRAVASGTTRYHYNHALRTVPIVAEQNAGTSAFQRFYIWTPDGRLLYLIDATAGNAVSYFHFDLTGSTLALSSGAGAVTDAYAYSPYGELLARTGTNPQPFTYVGRYGVRAETNAALYQMRARFYDPVTARFLSRDPLWPRVADPASLNPYGYAANNPLRFIDPSGTLSVQESATPLTTIAREDIENASVQSIGDVLKTIPGVAPSPHADVNLRGLGSSRTLVLVNGRRLAFGSGSDLNTIPSTQIERVEVLKDGASSIYGSDAIAGVVNVITRKDNDESAYGRLNYNVAWKFEGSLSLGADYAYNSLPDPAPEPQPVRSSGQVTLHSLAAEANLVGAYSALLSRIRNGERLGPFTGSAFMYFLLSGWISPIHGPRGPGFINGIIVAPKPEDLVYGAFLKEEFERGLVESGITPYQIYMHLYWSVMLGGSGGMNADLQGYRAIGLPPLEQELVR